MSFAAMMTETASVYRGAYSSAQSAGMIRANALIASDIACRDETMGASEQLMNAALGVPIDHRILTQYDGIRHDDILVVTGIVAGETVICTMRVMGAPIRRRAIGGMEGFYLLNAQEVKL